MNTSKHTQGQWVINKDNSISTNSFDKVLIAQVCSANNNDQEQKSNAKLIAAAPELLEALEAALAFIPKDCQDYFKSTILKATK